MESHVRGLESLGRSHDSYGNLLVPIVLGKLPLDPRTTLARDHDTPSWKFEELRESILKELRIVEAGVHVNSTRGTHQIPSPTVANSFLIQKEGRHPQTASLKRPEVDMGCTYCKGPHTEYKFQVVTDCQEKWSVIKRVKLYSNCPESHKSSACQSRHRCYKCKGKHHPSLCTAPTATHPPSTIAPDTSQQGSSQTSCLQSSAPIHATIAPSTNIHLEGTPAFSRQL